MVSYVFSPNSVATGDVTDPGAGGDVTFTPTSLPIQAFLDDLAASGVDVSNAQIILTLPGDAEDYADGIPSSAEFTIGIDIDGNGVIDPTDYDVAPAPRNDVSTGSSFQFDNLVGGNLGELNGDFGIYPAGSTEAVETASGPFYVTSDAGGFTVDDPLVITGGGSGALDVDEVPIVCFVRGTMIETPDGPRLVEDLSVGDLVMTKDHGAQPVRWIGSRKVAARSLARYPNLMPIRIAAGAFGPGVPQTDLVVSPQHRVLIASRVVRNMFGTDEVLVSAKKLLGFPGVTRESVSNVEYFHILLDRHEMVRANGAWSETLLTGPMALRALGPEAVREISLLFPEIASPSYVAPPARRIAEGKRIPQMVARHIKNQRPLYDPCIRSA